MPQGIKYAFTARLWKHDGPAGWYFVSLPLALSIEIKRYLQEQEEGWGRMKAIAKVKRRQWNTAIWFDKKHNTYLLPIKAEIRKSAYLELEEEIEVDLFL